MTPPLCVTLARSRELCEALPTLYAESAGLIVRARELCMPYRRMRGASDLESPFIAEIIARTPMCAECLAKQAGIADGAVRDGLGRLREFMALTSEISCCDGCQRVATVYRLGEGTRDGHPSVAPPRLRPALVTQSEALWKFLESRRGEMFCTQCISNALMATKRIDRAILSAEGRGARRQYGSCVICGKERLLCGLTR